MMGYTKQILHNGWCSVKDRVNICIGYVGIKREAKWSTNSWDTSNDVSAVDWATVLSVRGQ